MSKEKHPSANGEPFEALFLHLNTDFLKRFRKENHIAVPASGGKRITRQNVFRLNGHPFLKGLFLSLADYFQADTYPSKELMESKLREAVYVLLQLKPELTPVLFDFVDQWKVDIGEFMEETGESASEVYLKTGFKNLSHFSTAFKKEYGIPPSHLMEKVG